MHFRSTTAIALILCGCCCSHAADGPAQIDPSASQRLTTERLDEIEKLVEELGSNQFARRERAATALLQTGTPAIAVLKRIEKTAEDPEVRDRIAGLVRQISESDIQTKIDQFIAGRDVGFHGWDRFRKIMGDSVTSRELFVEVHQEHPDLLASLDRDPKEIQLAMDAVNARVQHRMFVTRQHPTQADTIALLLPAFNEKISFQPGYEITIIGVLDRLAAQQLRRDAHLEPGLRRLLGAWVSRSTLDNRIEALAKAMQWDVPESLPIAKSTISETDDMQTLVVAMQTIARFGDKKDAGPLKDLLADDRVTGEAGYGNQQLIQSQVRDVAIATIAILHDVPLAEIGFPRASTHASFGFTILGIGFAKEEDSARQKSLLQAKALITPQPTNGS